MKKASLEARAFALCALVVAGNVALLALLAGHPFAQAQAQLCAGGCAIALHGWCAWEIGRLILGFKKQAAREAFDARVELFEAAKGLGAYPTRALKKSAGRKK